MMLLAFIPNKAYCVDLVKGEWYSIPLQDGTKGKYIYYGSGNGGIFFLDQEAYNAATKAGLPVIPSNGTMPSIVNNFVVNGKSYTYKSATSATIGNVTKVPETTYVDYLTFYGGYHLYEENVELCYLYSEGDTHYFVNNEVLNYIQYYGQEKFHIYDKELIDRIPRDNKVIVSSTFDKEHKDDYVIEDTKWYMGQGKDPEKDTIDDETYKELVRRLEELGLDVDDLKEKYDLLDLENKAISEKIDILLLLFTEHIEEFNASFTDNEGTRFIDLFKLYTSDSLDNSKHSLQLLQKLYGKTYRDLDEYEYQEDEVTLSEQIADLQENIVDSLTATNEKTLEELNKTLLTTNKFLSMVMVLLLITLVLALALFVGWVVHTIIKRNVY